MTEAEDKQETIGEFKPLSRLIGGTRNNLAKVVKMFLLSFSSYPEHSVHGNSYTPFSIMLLTDPTYPVANRLAKMNFSSNLTCGQNIFNEEPACLEMVWNFYYLGLLQGNGFYQ